jgi:hypothetical protein
MSIFEQQLYRNRRAESKRAGYWSVSFGSGLPPALCIANSFMLAFSPLLLRRSFSYGPT